LVKDGEHVEAGTQLSDGIVRPDDVVRIKGLGEGRLYYARRLKQMLDDGGTPANPRQAEIVARAARPDPVPLRRTPEQIEREVEAVLARWPDAGITNIAVITGVMDGRLRRTQAWQRHKAAKEGG
jgi:hypothetical protein